MMKDPTVQRIERMEADRAARRKTMAQRQKSRVAENLRNIAQGNPGDVDFIGMVRTWRNEHAAEARPYHTHQPGLCIAVRKRPISDKERQKEDHDAITCLNPAVWIHAAKFKVDGITKYLDHTSFCFDHAFAETATTEDVYRHTTFPLLDSFVNGGKVTVFAYGQTGSGKTYTMNGIQELLCDDLYSILPSHTKVFVSFFELYGGMVQDLLHERQRLKILEDGKGEVVIHGLRELEAPTPASFHEIARRGNAERTTHTTEANDTSSRSHAICQIVLRDAKDRVVGKLSLVDLAGSERGADTKSHNAQRRAESGHINASLLALKECIRALGKSSKHVPYRSSRLTMVLKDCFTSADAKTTMIATVSPGASSADHTINTLRYADRIKEKKMPGKSPVVRPTKPKAPAPKISDDDLDAALEEPSDHELSDVLGEQEESPSETLSNDLSTALGDKGQAPSEAPSNDLDLSDILTEESEKGESHEAVENALRETVQSIFEQEEAILSTHMRNIQENAELLTEEGKLLRAVQRDGVTEAEMDEYVATLSALLDRKEEMILGLQDKLFAFSESLEKENELSQKVGRLRQY